MPRNKLTKEERIYILKTYWKLNNSQAVIKAWKEKYDTTPPTRKAIYLLCKKFDETGSVHDAPRSGRPATVFTEENKKKIAETFSQSPKSSERKVARDLEISRRSLHRILGDLKIKPFKQSQIIKRAKVSETDDATKRLKFCKSMLSELEKKPNLLDCIVWSDEANFKLSGTVNRHNCVYLANGNIPLANEHLSNEPEVTVWGAITTNGIIGPYFFDGPVTAISYLNMLTLFALPALQQQPGFNELYFQQDRTPAHHAPAVRAFLNATFPKRWIGQGGSVEYPAQSPDLTPMDFFFWGVIKDIVFSGTPQTMEEMKAYITDAFRNINADRLVCQRVCRSVFERFQQCVKDSGSQVGKTNQ